MKVEQLESNWENVKGQVQERWAKFTTEDMASIRGKKDKLIASLRQRYGYNAEKAEQELDKFVKECNCSSDTASKGNSSALPNSKGDARSSEVKGRSQVSL